MLKLMLGLAAGAIFCAAHAEARIIEDTNAPFDLFEPDVNDASKNLLIVAWCDATSDSKELTGYVGDKENLRVASAQSGAGKMSITFVVPSHKWYKVDAIMVGGGRVGSGVCYANASPI